MRLRSMNGLNPEAVVDRLSSWPTSRQSHVTSHHSADLLQRTQDASGDGPPDPRYWIAYDRFMVEREARAKRREYIYGLIGKGWRALRARIAALTDS